MLFNSNSNKKYVIIRAGFLCKCIIVFNSFRIISIKNVDVSLLVDVWLLYLFFAYTRINDYELHTCILLQKKFNFYINFITLFIYIYIYIYLFFILFRFIKFKLLHQVYLSATLLRSVVE